MRTVGFLARPRGVGRRHGCCFLEAVQLLAVAGLALVLVVVLVAYGRRTKKAPPRNDVEPEATASEGDEPRPVRSGIVARGDKNLPRLHYDEDTDEDATRLGAVQGDGRVIPIVYDADAENVEPTGASPLILTVGSSQTDPGKKRRRNEDSLLVSESNHLYVVADGMGGYHGGDVASRLAVEVIERVFREKEFNDVPTELPRRAAELAQAIQRANAAVHQKASEEPMLAGMGTTVCAVRFSPRTQRLYVGHVGDSRAYRFRGGVLTLMTTDHTMGNFGAQGDEAALLSRAVGVWSTVPVDIVVGKPRPGDTYLLCSDGLSKMAPLEQIREILATTAEPEAAARRLVDLANENGGADNVSVIVVRVSAPAAEVLTG